MANADLRIVLATETISTRGLVAGARLLDLFPKPEVRRDLELFVDNFDAGLDVALEPRVQFVRALPRHCRLIVALRTCAHAYARLFPLRRPTTITLAPLDEEASSVLADALGIDESAHSNELQRAAGRPRRSPSRATSSATPR